jgi:hypothetical protein
MGIWLELDKKICKIQDYKIKVSLHSFVLVSRCMPLTGLHVLECKHRHNFAIHLLSILMYKIKQHHDVPSIFEEWEHENEI